MGIGEKKRKGIREKKGKGIREKNRIRRIERRTGRGIGWCKGQE